MNRLVAFFAVAMVCACSTSENVDPAKVLRDGGAAMGKLTSANAT